MNYLSKIFPVFLIFCCFETILSQTLPHDSKDDQAVISKIENEAVKSSKEWNGDAIRRSANLFLQAAEERKNAKQPHNATENLRKSVHLFLLLGDYQSGLIHLSKALKSDEENNYLEGKIKTLSLLSKLSLNSGKTDESKKYLTKALMLSEKTIDPTAKAMALYAAGEFHYYQSDAEKPVAFYEESLKYWQKTQNYSEQFQTLIGLSYAYAGSGDALSGLKKVIEAESLAKANGDARGEALAKVKIGNMNLILDEKQTALNIYQKAEAEFPDDFDFIEKARLLNAIGSIYEDYGQWKLSLNYRARAFELYGKEKYLYGQLATLPSLGKLSFLNNDQLAALNYFNDGSILAERLDDDFYRAVIWKEMADMYRDTASNAQATEYYLKALRLGGKLNKRLTAIIQENLGEVYEKQNNPTAAKKYYLSALEISRNIKNKFGEAKTLYNLAVLDESENRAENALEKIKESLAITESLYIDVASNNLRRTYLSNAYQRYEFYIHLLMKLDQKFPGQNYAELALQISEKARARTFLETLRLAETDPVKNISPELVGIEKAIRVKLSLKSDALTELLANNSKETEAEELSNEVAQLTDEYEKIKGEIKLANPEYASLKESVNFDINAFQRQFLDDQTVLLEFSLGEKQSYLWLVDKTEIKTVILPPQRLIEPKIRKLLELLTEREMRDGEELEVYLARLKSAELEYNQKAKALSRELLGQVADKLGNKRLLVVADGILNYFPLSALPAPDSDELLISKHEIVYQPSASAISLLQSKPNKISASKDVLVFADAIFSQNDARVKAEKSGSEMVINTLTEVFRSSRQFESVKGLARLEASQKEAAAISDTFGSSRSLVISGADVRRERVLETDLADYRIVHFATHGLLNEDRPEFSSMVFSLYDEQGEPLKGFLRLQDIYNLNLNADLVVLSACDSAIGKEIKGEGVISLTRGFMQAGSKSVLSSLWKVEDNATAEMMRIFYEKLSNEKLTPPEALRRAQIEMAQNSRYASPFYWAAFTVQGEYRYEIAKPSVFSANSIYAGLAGILIIGCGGIFVYRKFYRRGY